MLGVPGTGKTTFGKIFRKLAESEKLKLLSLSLDDFYLPFANRDKLRKENPKFMWRGPPGTHDV